MIGLLDVFRLERDGEVVAQLYDRTSDLLLALLALPPRAARNRDQLATTLWPDRSIELARNRLAVTLHILRKQLADGGLPDDAILTNRHVLQLHPSIATDVQLFEDGVAAALREYDSGAQVRFLEPALRMYGHGLLPLLAEDWVQPERERLARMNDQAVRLLADALKREGIDDRMGAMGGDVSPGDQVRYYLRGQPTKPLVAQLVADRGPGGPAERYLHSAERLPESRFAPPITASPAIVEDLQRRSADHCLELAEQAAPYLVGAQRGVWLDRLDTEYDNIRAALEWAYEKGNAAFSIRLSGALWRYWLARSRVGPGRLFLDRALSMKTHPHTAADARALHGAGALALQDGDLDRSRALLGAATSIWRKLENFDGVACVLNNVGIAAYKAGDYAAARKAHEESLGLIRKVGTPEVLAIMLKDAALVEIADGNYEQAEALLQERLRLGRELDDLTTIASTLANLGTVAQFRGNTGQARAYAEEGLRLAETAGNLKGVAFALRLLGHVTQSQGDLGAAKALHESCLSISKSLHDERGIGETLRYLGEISEEVGDFAEARRCYDQSFKLLESVGDAAGAAKSQAALARLEAAQPIKEGREAL